MIVWVPAAASAQTVAKSIVCNHSRPTTDWVPVARVFDYHRIPDFLPLPFGYPIYRQVKGMVYTRFPVFGGSLTHPFSCGRGITGHPRRDEILCMLRNHDEIPRLRLRFPDSGGDVPHATVLLNRIIFAVEIIDRDKATVGSQEGPRITEIPTPAVVTQDNFLTP